MKKKFLNNSIYLFFFVCLFLLSVYLYFSPRSGIFYFWGKKLDLKPNYLFSLDYAPGKFFVYEVPDIENANINEMLSIIQASTLSRISNYYQQNANIFLENKDEQTLLIIETPSSVIDESLNQLLTVPGRLRIFIQKEEISEEEMILSDDWLSGFDLLEGVTEKDLISTKAQIDFQTKQPVISLVFNDGARKLLLKETRENKSKTLMVMLDDNIVLMSPISEPIFNGKLVISGGRSLYQAEIYAAVLVSKASPITPAIIDREVTIDLDKYQNRPKVSLFGLREIEQWQAHLLLVSGIIFLSLIIMGISLKYLGLFASMMMMVSFFLNFVYIRLSRTIISFELIVAMATIWLWLLLMTQFFLREMIFIKKNGNNSAEAIKKVFSPRRKLIRRSLGIIFLSIIAITSISKSKFFGHYSSVSFVQVMQQLSIFNIFIYSFSVLVITKYLLKDKS